MNPGALLDVERVDAANVDVEGGEWLFEVFDLACLWSSKSGVSLSIPAGANRRSQINRYRDLLLKIDAIHLLASLGSLLLD